MSPLPPHPIHNTSLPLQYPHLGGTAVLRVSWYLEMLKGESNKHMNKHEHKAKLDRMRCAWRTDTACHWGESCNVQTNTLLCFTPVINHWPTACKTFLLGGCSFAYLKNLSAKGLHPFLYICSELGMVTTQATAPFSSSRILVCEMEHAWLIVNCEQSRLYEGSLVLATEGS